MTPTPRPKRTLAQMQADKRKSARAAEAARLKSRGSGGRFTTGNR